MGGRGVPAGVGVTTVGECEGVMLELVTADGSCPEADGLAALRFRPPAMTANPTTTPTPSTTAPTARAIDCHLGRGARGGTTGSSGGRGISSLTAESCDLGLRYDYGVTASVNTQGS
jgi:hypothetical protein